MLSEAPVLLADRAALGLDVLYTSENKWLHVIQELLYCLYMSIIFSH